MTGEPAGRSRRAGWWANRPLRVKLPLVTAAFVALALLISGFASVTALNRYLVGQVDRQLNDVIRQVGDGTDSATDGIPGNSTAAPGTDTSNDGIPGNSTAAPGTDTSNDGIPGNSTVPPDTDSRNDGIPGSSDTATSARPRNNDSRRIPGQFYVEYRDRSGDVTRSSASFGTSDTPDIPAMTPAELRQQGNEPFTVSSVDGSTEWRVSIKPLTSGSVAVARSLSEVGGVTRQLSLLLLVVGVWVILILAALATWVVRRNLRPLTHIERTANRITAGDWSPRVDSIAPNTEVGHVGIAVNSVLDQLQTSFDQREQALAEARASEERMRRFVADASHELRTPLTSIRGYADLYLQGAVASDETDRAFNRIQSESVRMTRLVEDMLMLARLDQQRPLDLGRVDLLAVARDVAVDAEAAYPGRAIRVSAGGGVPIVSGDEQRLRQVIVNLVSNALNYSPEDTPVRIAVSEAAGEVTVSVTDQGPGIPPELKGQIFERFFRGDASRNREVGGNGLGLSIASAIVKAHGGSISVTDAEPTGTTFTLTLAAG